MDSSMKDDADRIVTIALLNSFYSFELFALGAFLISGLGAMSSTNLLTGLLQAAGCVTGFSVFYMGLRIRLDAGLFEKWSQLDSEELDRVLKQINPDFKGNRSLASRLEGARSLFRRGTQLVALQALLALITIGSRAL